jgi:hypothetical protein
MTLEKARGLIREFDFETLFGFKPGTVFKQPV